MAVEKAKGAWVPLMEYSMRREISLSTLRRHIKSNKIQYRFENGKYLVFDDGASSKSKRRTTNEESAKLHSKLNKVESELQKAQEEIAELKTLIALYEEKMPQPLDH